MANEAGLLATLPDWAFAGMLLVTRLGSAAMLLPGIGEAELPMTLRAAFVLAAVCLLLPVLGPAMPQLPASLPELAVALLAEIVTGLWLGWLTRLVLLALPMAGQMIAAATGMTSVLQPDPLLGASSAALSRLLGLAAPVLVMATGLHAVALRAVVGSYDMIAPGQLLPVGGTVEVYVGAVAQSFALAFRLAAPFLMAGLLFHGVVGLVSRLVPHLQMHFATMPGQILGGLALLGVIVMTLTGTWLSAARVHFAGLPGT